MRVLLKRNLCCWVAMGDLSVPSAAQVSQQKSLIHEDLQMTEVHQICAELKGVRWNFKIQNQGFLPSWATAISQAIRSR
jgi:hypothetical protein